VCGWEKEYGHPEHFLDFLLLPRGGKGEGPAHVRGGEKYPTWLVVCLTFANPISKKKGEGGTKRVLEEGHEVDVRVREQVRVHVPDGSGGGGGEK
jgi:hypothetical protein